MTRPPSPDRPADGPITGEAVSFIVITRKSVRHGCTSTPDFATTADHGYRRERGRQRLAEGGKLKCWVAVRLTGADARERRQSDVLNALAGAGVAGAAT